MTYQEIIHRLQKIYDNGEAKAIARILLEERFGLSMTFYNILELLLLFGR